MASGPDLAGGLVGATLSRRRRRPRPPRESGKGGGFTAHPVQGGAPRAGEQPPPQFLGVPTVLSRFLEEGRTCMRLTHPNIVRVRECAVAEDGSPYLVMELCEGVPLSAYTQEGARVAVAQAVPIIQGILAGLAAAHT